MTLASSGTMSIGGTATDRSINVELGRSATATSSMGETDLRTLAGVSSGAISMSNFYGASSITTLWTTGITSGSATISGSTYTGYGNVSGTSFGSTTDSTCDLYSNNPSWEFYNVDFSNTFLRILDTSGTPTGNAGWTTLKIYNGTDDTGTLLATLSRTSLTYSSSSGLRAWDLGGLYSPNNRDRFLVFT